VHELGVFADGIRVRAVQAVHAPASKLIKRARGGGDQAAGGCRRSHALSRTSTSWLPARISSQLQSTQSNARLGVVLGDFACAGPAPRKRWSRVRDRRLTAEPFRGLVRERLGVASDLLSDEQLRFSDAAKDALRFANRIALESQTSRTS